MKAYLCAAYERREEMKGVADVLEAMGHTVVSGWVRQQPSSVGLSGLTPQDLAERTEYCGTFALADLIDIEGADTLIAFTDGQKARGGRHVEFGYAVALGKRLIVVGPREVIFHTLPAVQWYPTWGALVMSLAKQADLIETD